MRSPYWHIHIYIYIYISHTTFNITLITFLFLGDHVLLTDIYSRFKHNRLQSPLTSPSASAKNAKNSKNSNSKRAGNNNSSLGSESSEELSPSRKGYGSPRYLWSTSATNRRKELVRKGMYYVPIYVSSCYSWTIRGVIISVIRAIRAIRAIKHRNELA